MADVPANARLQALLRTEVDMRDAAWERGLDEWLPRATFSAPIAATSRGYRKFLEASPADGSTSGHSLDELALRTTDVGCGLRLGLRLTVQGGLAVEMSFGVIATYRMFHDWRSPSGWNGGRLAEGREVLRRAESVQTGAPNFDYLPYFIRTAMRRHLEAAGVRRPRVLLVLWPERSDHRDLAFNVTRAEFSPDVYSLLMDSLLWFLPDGYQVISYETVARFDATAAIL